MLDSRLDLLDVCQIFSEAMEDDSPFELEVVADFRRRRLIIRGSVRWYQVSEPQGDIRHFQAGLHLKEYESRTVAGNIVEFITGIAMD